MKKIFHKVFFLGALALAMVSCSGSDDTPDEGNNNGGENPISARYKHRVLIEDFTGIWCGYCPRVSYAIELLKETPELDNYVFGAVHNGDVLTVSGTGNLATSLWTKFKTPSNQRGYPFSVINRTAAWKYPEPNNLAQPKDLVQAQGVPVGIKISSELSATGGNVSFSIKLGQTVNNGLKYVCYVIENGVVRTDAPQSNYYEDLYGGVEKIADFVHNDVFLKSTGNIVGTDIPADQTKDGAEISFNKQSITYTSHSKKVENLEVVVMVLNDKGDVLNIRKAKANQTADYEKM